MPLHPFLKLVPWGAVLEHLPTLARQANRLYDEIRRRRREDAPVPTPDPDQPPETRIALLEEQLLRAQARNEAQEALLKVLVEQTDNANAALLRLHQRQRWLIRLTGLALALALAALALVLRGG